MGGQRAADQPAQGRPHSLVLTLTAPSRDLSEMELRSPDEAP